MLPLRKIGMASAPNALLAVVLVLGASPSRVVGEVSGTSSLQRVAPAAVVREQASASLRIPLIQYNMCSNECYQRRTASRNDLAWITAQAGAWAVSINEACFADLSHMVNAVSLSGYMVMSTVRNENAPNCPGTDKRFGNIVLYRGPYVDNERAYLSNPGRDCSQVECRTMICVAFNTYVGQSVSCSSHFERRRNEGTSNDNLSLIQQQANEYIYIASAFSGPRKYWVSGDFNLTPALVPSVYYSNAMRANYGNTVSASNPTRQLDYIFIEGTATIGNYAPYCNPAASDHCLVRGDIAVT